MDVKVSGVCEVQEELGEGLCAFLRRVEGVIGTKAGLVHDSIEISVCAWMCPPSVREVCCAMVRSKILH